MAASSSSSGSSVSKDKEEAVSVRWIPSRGDLVWFPDPKDSWRCVACYEVTQDEKVKTELGLANVCFFELTTIPIIEKERVKY